MSGSTFPSIIVFVFLLLTRPAQLILTIRTGAVTAKVIEWMILLTSATNFMRIEGG